MRNLLAACLALVVLSSFFSIARKTKLKLPDEFAKIPAGVVYRDSGTTIQVKEFYLSKFEVSNKQYREFYNEVAKELSLAEKAKIACDTLAWIAVSNTPGPMSQYYYQHPAYNNYPVVNVSYEGAIAYCKWYEQKLEASNPGFDFNVSLPTRDQREYAAMGKRSQAIYPWGNYYLRNKKGEFLCNFKIVADQSIYRNRQTGKPEIHLSTNESDYPTLMEVRLYTTPVKSFYPNDFGLYNICGNAAEMIHEKGVAMGGSWNDFGGDVHIRAESRYDKAGPTIGFRPVITVSPK